MNASIDDLAKALMAAGIEKLSISSPVYTMRDEPTRPTDRGMWQVSIKANSMRSDWTRGRWKPTLAEALESCLGPIETSPEVEDARTAATSLADIL